MLSIRIGGTWLRAIGPFADVTHIHAWPHGFDQATWRMPPTLRHPTLDRGGAIVEAFVGGIRRGIGRLAEPAADGQYVANGAWSEAAGVYAVDAGGDATVSTNEAIQAAIDRGALTWTLPPDTAEIVWGEPTQPLKLLQLLDEATKGAGMRWWIDADGAFRITADPTEPSYVVPQVAAGRGLTLAEDDYYSHLVGTYLGAGPVFATVTVGDDDAAARWGYREAPVDLTDMGLIDSTIATSELTGRLELTGARLQFAQQLQAGFGQITTPGGTPVSLASPRAGQMVRLMGITDQSRPAGNRPYTDIVIGRSTYTDGAPTLSLAPVGLAARNLEDILVRGAAA